MPVLLLLLALAPVPLLAKIPPHGAKISMPATPAVSPDGNQIVFEWRDDIWSIPASGGQATRLISHPARESHPQFSPDGNTIYFSSDREGELQVFSVPSSGGLATRHSFHSSGGALMAVAPDGKSALIRALRDNGDSSPYRPILIGLDGPSAEEPLFELDARYCTWLPDGSAVLFCRDGESVNRKGYKGPRASSLWAWSPGDPSFRKLIKEDSQARNPLPWPDSKGYYYLSERDGTLNLWSRTLDGSEDRQITHFQDEGIAQPAISANGRRIAFLRGFDLWTLRPGVDAAPQQLELWHAEDLPDIFSERRDVTGTIDADFSPSALETVFAAEGEIWAMDTVLREPHRLTFTPGTMEYNPRFSPDGKFIYFLADDGVSAQIWRLSRTDPSQYWWQAKEFTTEQITTDPAPKFGFSLSPDGKHLAWIAGRGSLIVGGLDGTQGRTLCTGWKKPEYDWSPDGKWIVYAVEDQNFNQDVFVASVTGAHPPYNISRHPDFDGSPKWSPDGRRIAFTGKRLYNRLNLFYVDLLASEASTTSRDRLREDARSEMQKDPLYQNHDNGSPTRNKGGEAAAPKLGRAEKPGAPEVEIDFHGLADRVTQLNINGIRPERLIWSADSKALLFQSSDESQKSLYQIAPRAEAKMRTLAPLRGIPIRFHKDGKLLWIVDAAPATLDKNGKLARYAIKTRITRKRHEWQRFLFRVAWRAQRDHFYDPGLNGRDWEAMREKYEEAAALAPGTRVFDTVVRRLLGELNSSHMNFTSTQEWPQRWQNAATEPLITRHVGLRFAQTAVNEPHVVASIIPDSPAAKALPEIQVGDVLMAVDGRPVDPETSLIGALNAPSGRDLPFTLRDSHGIEHTYRLPSISWREAAKLSREARISENRKRVEEWSEGKLGYIHVARMIWDDFVKFEHQIFDAGDGKEGLVIDIRDNDGGFTADHLLTILTQPTHATAVARDSTPGYPQDRFVYATWDKPVIVLCNQRTFSNGEIFAHAIKTLKRGKLVGTPTAGGVISTANIDLFKSAILRVPFRGWFLPSGEDMELNPAIPDLLLWPDPDDLVKGIDQQLETATHTLLEEITRHPKPPFVPHYRHRSHVDHTARDAAATSP